MQTYGVIEVVLPGVGISKVIVGLEGCRKQREGNEVLYRRAEFVNGESGRWVVLTQ